MIVSWRVSVDTRYPDDQRGEAAAGGHQRGRVRRGASGLL